MSSRTYHGFLWHAVFLSLAVTFTEVNTVIPALILRIGGSPIHVGIVSAIVIGIPLVTKLLFSSFLSSRSRKKPYLLAGIYLRILSLASIAFTLYSYERFVLPVLLLLIYTELLLFSMGGAFAGLPFVHLLGVSLDRELRTRFFTRRQLISSIGMLLSVLSARYILSRWEYPLQYVILFALAAISLLIASGGFWRIEEPERQVPESEGLLAILKGIPKLLKNDRSFFLFLIYTNIMGSALALIPFYIGYAQQVFSMDSTTLGSILLVQIAGMFTSSLIYPRIIGTYGFKGILRLRTLLHILLPVAAVLIARTGSLSGYLSIFFLIGTAVSARAVSEDAALIELSSPENRVIYTALAGTLNMAVILFPLILGSLIAAFGYSLVFLASGVLTVSAFPVLRSLSCPVDMKDTDSHM